MHGRIFERISGGTPTKMTKDTPEEFTKKFLRKYLIKQHEDFLWECHEELQQDFLNKS